MARRALVVVLLVGLLSQLAGCSLLFVRKAPSNVPEGAWADCSESMVLPAIDAIFGVSSVLGALGMGTSQYDNETDRDAARVAAPIYGLIGVGLLYSAYVGFRETSRCSKIHSAAEARGVYGPQPYYPPQPYPYPPQPYPYPPQPYPPQPYPQPYPQPAPPPQPQPYPQPPPP